jgi:hypothetical protein
MTCTRIRRNSVSRRRFLSQPALDFWAKYFDAPLPRAPLGFHSFFVVQHSLPLQNSLPTIDTFTLVCVKVTTFFSVRRE